MIVVADVVFVYLVRFNKNEIKLFSPQSADVLISNSERFYLEDYLFNFCFYVFSFDSFKMRDFNEIFPWDCHYQYHQHHHLFSFKITI